MSEGRSHGADVQLLLVSQDQDPPEQQDRSSSLDQEDPPELPHIKEEQEELWTNQEGEQLQGPEEAEIIKFTFNPVAVKSEEDDDEEGCQLHHQRQTEEIKAEADGEDCGGPGPAMNCDPDTDEKSSDCSEPETDNSDDWRRSSDAESGLNSVKTDGGEKTISCCECGKQFSQNSSLKIHMRIHTGEKPFSCSVCSKSFRQKVTLTRHMALHTGEKRYSCSVCGKSFLWQSQLKNHLWVGCQSSQLHPSQTDKTRIAEHLETKADGEDCGGPEPDGNLNPESAASFGYKEDLQHNGTERKRFSCSLCENTFQWRGDVIKHMRVHTGEKPFSCSVCGKGFSQSYSLTKHLRIHTGEKPFTCSVCDASFSDRSNFYKHMRVHSEEKQLSCSVCGKTCANKENLKRHLTVHMENERFTCGVCGGKFLWQSQLKDHQCGEFQSARFHQSEESRDAECLKSESCEEDCGGPEPDRNSNPECAQSIEDQRDSGIQIELKSFSCSVCGKSFAEDKLLLDHMRRHSERKGFSCSVCSKTFQWRGDVVSHMRVHTGEKPLCCSFCGKGFAHSSHLTTHLRIHTGEKPFTCSTCKTSFSDRSNFSKHMRVHSGEKRFNCSVCGKTFAHKGNLKRHLTVHTGESKCVCRVCGLRFSRLTGVKKHKCVGENSGGQYQQD